MVADHAYAELGLAPGATEAEVKAAWRRLASQWHPDRNASAAAIDRMQRINEALAVIRQARRGPTQAPTPPAPDDAPAARAAPDDKPAPGRTLRRKLKLTLEEAAAGCVKTLRGKLVDRCGACASAGFRVLAQACADCQGSGRVRTRGWFGYYGDPQACTTCGGDGRARQPCTPCGGSGRLPDRPWRIDVRIPHGVRDGDHLQAGEKHRRDGLPPLTLDLAVELLPHPLFELGADGSIWCEVPVDGFQWIANRSIDVPTLGGLRKLRLNREQLSYRLTGEGFPAQRRGTRADHLISLKPLFPAELGTDQQILLDQLVASANGPGSPAAPPRLSDWRRALRDWEQSTAHPRRPEPDA